MSVSLSKTVSCGHCSNLSNMKIIGNVYDQESNDDPEIGFTGYSGNNYSILECPACKGTNIVSYFWHDSMDGEEDVRYRHLYPINDDFPIGLPEEISSTLIAAEKIKTIDVNAYVTLLRRLLEMICIDKHAKGGSLAAMLADLAKRGDIPDKLVLVAKGLRDFGNLGAHAGLGKLSESEIPIVKALTYAILEYIYSAPHLASIAEEKLKAIKSTGR